MRTITMILLLTCFCLHVFAQDETTKEDHSYKPLQANLSEDGSKYIRFIMWHQLWVQAGSEQTGPNFSIRRSRFLAYAQISSKFMILTHWGLNSLGAGQLTGNPNTQQNNQQSLLFLHDAWGEYQVVKDKLYVGAGLHYWNGISRLTNQSTLNMMTMDNPGSGNSDVRLFPWNNITTSDQFARHIGFYAKGTLGNFNYRVSANNARANTGTLDPNIASYQVTGVGTGAWNFAGYFNYDFLDKESNKLPYFVGSYLGKKKVFSVGAGFFVHPGAMATGTPTQDPNEWNRSGVTHFGIDAFYDAPLTDKLAINALGAFYNYDFGNDGFAAGGLVPSSGSVVYGQLGLLLRDINLMPYVTFNSASMESTPNGSSELALGLNYFINGHFAKITGEYSTGTRGTEGAESTNIFRLQLHFFL